MTTRIFIRGLEQLQRRLQEAADRNRAEAARRQAEAGRLLVLPPRVADQLLRVELPPITSLRRRPAAAASRKARPKRRLVMTPELLFPGPIEYIIDSIVSGNWVPTSVATCEEPINGASTTETPGDPSNTIGFGYTTNGWFGYANLVGWNIGQDPTYLAEIVLVGWAIDVPSQQWLPFYDGRFIAYDAQQGLFGPASVPPGFLFDEPIVAWEEVHNNLAFNGLLTSCSPIPASAFPDTYEGRPVLSYGFTSAGSYTLNWPPPP